MDNLRLNGTVLCLVLVTGCGSEPVDSKLDVIYGDDNRKEVYQANANEKNWWRSTVALIQSSSLRSAGAGYTLPTNSFGSAYNLCTSEPFREQPNPAFCSGFLVAPDVIATAGHCVRTQSDCNSTSFVFGFGYETKASAVTQLAANQVYNCSELIHSELTANGADFALVRLSRTVSDRSPVTFRRQGAPEPGAELTLIGHPAGLPAKVAPSAKVRNVVGNTHLVASTDSYGGNSGSAVFNSTTGVVEGILVRGEQDFTTQGSCRVSYRCSETGCRGEDVTLTAQFASYVTDNGDNGDHGDGDNGGGGDTDPTPGNLFSASGINLAIPDNTPAGVSYKFTVAANVSLQTLTVDLTIEHTYIGDLRVTLTSPDGRSAVLHNRSGGGTDNINNRYTSDSSTALAALQTATSQGDWTLTIVDVAARDTGTLQSLTLSVNDAGGDTGGETYTNTYTADGLNTSIPDNNSTGVTQSLNVNQAGFVADLQVTVAITHSYIGDLKVELVHPDGTTVTLHNRSGGSANDLNQTWVLSDYAGLQTLRAKSASGAWRLKVSDNAFWDVGKLHKFQLVVSSSTE